METLYPIESFPAGERSITVLINRSATYAEEEALLKTLKELLEEFDKFPGTAGSEVFRQEQGGGVEFSIAQRFVSEADHEAWLKSPSFADWQRKIAPSEPGVGHVRRYSGLEAIFVSAKAPDAPPRWKMAVILTIAVFPMSLAMSYWFAPALANMSPLTGTLITSPIMVIVMTYVMVPILTKMFACWLAP